MGVRLLTNYYETASVILFSIGFATLFLHRNLIKKIIGLNIAETAVYLYFVAKGYITGRAAPIIAGGIQEADAYVNPVPTGLILTGIVISVSVTAFALALIVKIYKQYETLDLDEIMILAGKEEEG
ncbi:MAG: cation:proton antiporter subunit C [Clostridiales bacterium]|nr:cation:proton antiporter subunit C [Clostridiales bacterium]